eukprot:46621-Eustigmatos_ZCMA.PRE.1
MLSIEACSTNSISTSDGRSGRNALSTDGSAPRIRTLDGFLAEPSDPATHSTSYKVASFS